MRRLAIAAALAALLALSVCPLAGGLAPAAEREGSIPEDLAARKPPKPNDLYVAVLPFWAIEPRQADTARACVLLNLLRHGFRLAPRGAPNLAALVRQTDSAVRRDPAREPLARLEAQDAARIGKRLGADWVVYGEVGDLHTQSEKGGLMARKLGVVDLRLAVVETSTGEVVFWARVQDAMSGSTGLFRAKATSLERALITRTINAIFDDIGRGMPEHYTSSPVTSELVRQTTDLIKS